MTYTLQLGASGITSFSTASVSRYISLGNSAIALATGATARPPMQIATPVPGILSRLYVWTSGSNNRSTDTTVTVEVNGSAATTVATILANTAGIFTDTQHNTVLAANDKFNLVLTTGSGAGSFNLREIRCAWTPTDNSTTAFFAATNNNTNYSTASTTYYTNIFGWHSQDMTAADTYSRCLTVGTLSGLWAYVTTARTTDSTLRLLVNGSNVTQTKTLLANTTGLFTDTTHTDSVAATDDICISVTTGIGVDSLLVSSSGVVFTSSTGGAHPIMSVGTPNTTLQAGLTNWFTCQGGHDSYQNATPDIFGSISPVAGTLSKMAVRVNTNASTTDATFISTINGSAGAQTQTITALTSNQWFSDTTHSDAVAVGDKVCWKGTGATTSNIGIQAVCALLTVPADPITFKGQSRYAYIRR